MWQESSRDQPRPLPLFYPAPGMSPKSWPYFTCRNRSEPKALRGERRWVAQTRHDSQGHRYPPQTKPGPRLPAQRSPGGAPHPPPPRHPRHPQRPFLLLQLRGRLQRDNGRYLAYSEALLGLAKGGVELEPRACACPPCSSLPTLLRALLLLALRDRLAVRAPLGTGRWTGCLWTGFKG